jgi:RNA polymerase sigma-70 factor (ECF subfamily)
MVSQSPADRVFEIERLYASRYRSCYRLALSATQDPGAAHDAVQEGFARALAGHAQLRDERALEAWICRIIIRCALDSRRRTDVGAAALPPEVPLAWLPELPHPDRDPELGAALRALPPRQRVMVFLRYFADLPLATIAELCGARPGTVSATLAQAKASLAARLTPTGEQEQTEGLR